MIALALLLFTLVAHGAEPAVHAENGWLRLLPGSLPAGGYLTLINATPKEVSITGVRSPDYKEAMLHRSSENNGMAHMAMVDSVPVPARGSVVFSPGGYHVMLSKPTRSLKVADTVVLELMLSDGASLRVPLRVVPANASGPNG
ncbi:copper chaperone PCu(A)C [Bacillus sp. NP157]|nr:copper chaperone PCu(A)C [Bacillus sp. NP157]